MLLGDVCVCERPGDRVASLEAEPVAAKHHQEHSQQGRLIFSKYSKEAHLNSQWVCSEYF